VFLPGLAEQCSAWARLFENTPRRISELCGLLCATLKIQTIIRNNSAEVLPCNSRFDVLAEWRGVASPLQLIAGQIQHNTFLPLKIRQSERRSQIRSSWSRLHKEH
jgi:hypothetical protein